MQVEGQSELQFSINQNKIHLLLLWAWSLRAPHCVQCWRIGDNEFRVSLANGLSRVMHKHEKDVKGTGELVRTTLLHETSFTFRVMESAHGLCTRNFKRKKEDKECRFGRRHSQRSWNTIHAAGLSDHD